MSRGIRVTIAMVLGAAAFAAGQGSAAADGLPVPGGLDTTRQGVLSTDGSQRFIAVSHGDVTLLQRIDTSTSELESRAWLEGDWSVPGVALDGSTSGLAHDGGTLVLIKPRVGFPQKETSMLVVDAKGMKAERPIMLDGDFSFDAISPDGKWAYLIQYPNPGDPTNYKLRRLELASGELQPGSLLPQNEPDEEMRGFPLSRATGLDGRWDYTLYDGGNIYRYGGGKPGEPFVHAIDTVAGVTLCIDVDFVTPRQLGMTTLQMSDDGSQVELVDADGNLLGTIDAATGEAAAADPSGEDSEDQGAAAPGSDEGGGSDAAAIGFSAAALAMALGGAAMLIRRRPSRKPSTSSSVSA